MSKLQFSQATEEVDTAQARRPQWLQLCWIIIGVGLNWRCAFESFAGKSSFYSELVLGRTLLIALACAVVALLAVCVDREARWRHISPVFCLVSGVVYDILSVHWIAHRAK